MCSSDLKFKDQHSSLPHKYQESSFRDLLWSQAATFHLVEFEDTSWLQMPLCRDLSFLCEEHQHRSQTFCCIFSSFSLTQDLLVVLSERSLNSKLLVIL